MTQNEEILDFVVREFGVLQQRFGYHAPKVSHEDWMTRITYMKGEIGIELELDWREGEAFLLAVRLEDGKLPKGYYVANDEKCRLHVMNIARARGWPGVQHPSQPTRAPGASDPMKDMILSHKRLLLSCLPLLERDWDGIWQ
jgi:hypothetical protein